VSETATIRGESRTAAVGLGRFALYFLRLGATGYGGPIALAGYMQRDLVDERGWISRRDYLDGLALAQLAPGPLAAQLAMYLGYVRGGAFGATVVAVAFILPSFLAVWAISVAYVKFSGLGIIQALFYGVGAAVIGVIARSAWRLTRLTLGRQPVLWSIFGVLAAATAWTEQEILWLFLAAGLVPLAFAHRKPVEAAALLPVLPAVGGGIGIASRSLPGLFWFFAKAGAFVFGSGLAIVPFLYGGVVQQHHWLTDRQFLDAVAVAMITPGPVVITVAFIGYLVGGFWGMVAAAAGVFLPVYLFVVIPAPYFRRHSEQPQIRLFVQGVTAAAAGAIAGATVVLARRAFVDWWTVALGVVTLLVLMRWKISELWLIGAAAAIGLWLRG
jgi:chromate transporter